MIAIQTATCSGKIKRVKDLRPGDVFKHPMLGKVRMTADRSYEQVAAQQAKPCSPAETDKKAPSRFPVPAAFIWLWLGTFCFLFFICLDPSLAQDIAISFGIIAEVYLIIALIRFAKNWFFSSKQK